MYCSTLLKNIQFSGRYFAYDDIAVRFPKSTQGGTTTDIDNTLSNNAKTYKVVKDNQVLILRDGKIYNTMGQSLTNF